MIRSLRNPEIKVIDTTSKTNRHNRPLVCVCSVDAENKNACTLTSLLCDETRTSFDFTLKSMAYLHGSEHLKANSVFLSDGDQQIINSIKKYVERGMLNNNTKTRLCFWHAVILYLTNELSEGKNNNVANLVIKILIFYVQLASYGEDIEESNFHWNNMMKWLDESLKNKKIKENMFSKSIKALKT